MLVLLVKCVLGQVKMYVLLIISVQSKAKPDVGPQVLFVIIGLQIGPIEKYLFHH